jgi:hypothetical protein
MLTNTIGRLAAQNILYPGVTERKISAGKTKYYIDPQGGNDENTGTNIRKPWKTFKPANQLILGAGDELLITRPGSFEQSLVIMAKGTAASPVKISFAPGSYHFFPTGSFKTRLHISNTNDTPYDEKAIAIYVAQSRHVTLNAQGAKIILRGKMIETSIDQSENIHLKGMSFDYQRPTLSELTVWRVTDTYADLKIHRDSRYSIKDSVLTWEGEGWRYQAGWYWQSLNVKTGVVSRIDLPLSQVKFVEQGEFVRAWFKQNPGFKTGWVYQTRDVIRDCAGIFMQRSKHILLEDIRIYFMHGMGIVSQFCENITMDSVIVKPDENSGRTCAAWADILHFSGCRGAIEIKNSYLSAANDDAINVHGTHLRIVENPNPTQIRVRFMHNQTYGFEAFIPGDSINLIRAKSLLSYGDNVIVKSEMLNDKEILLTLKTPISSTPLPDDVVENVSWTPSLWVHHTTIAKIPTRGILVTTRRKTVIENNIFERTNGSAILVEDDAESWFESGLVKNLTIKHNTFLECGDPVIHIHPENKEFHGPVHQNISITQNRFELQNTKPLKARSTSNLQFKDNTIKSQSALTTNDLVEVEHCENVKVSGNNIEH